MGRTSVALAAVGAVMLSGACSVDDSKTTGASSSKGAPKTVTLVTHDSWVMDKSLAAQFTKETGYTLVVKKSGDAGQLANKLVLSKANPEGDVVFGVDNSFASRVTKAGVLQPYTSKSAPASSSKFDLPQGQGKGELSPIDTGAVCVNVDDAWFESHKIAKPTSLDDLTKPQYKNLMVTPGASSSSPGMAFLLATIGKYGENGWKPYWNKLMANGLKLTSGWSDAWGVDYSAGDGKGPRPIVVSYDSSPAGTTHPTSALLNTCFRSSEFAGVLTGAKNADGAKAFIDFMEGKAFQKALPEAMYVYPVDETVELPKEWSEKAKRATSTIDVSPAQIDSNREKWLTEWKDVTSK